jgi:hypothetical protein
MATELQSSALMEDVGPILAADGSPYFVISVVVHAGGKEYTPHQIIRIDVARVYRTAYMDDHSIVLTFGAGTMMNSIVPFSDDLRITISKAPASEDGVMISSMPVSVRTYKAYMGDNTDSTAESGSNAAMQDTDTADRFSIIHTQFVLEEVAVQQLRSQSIGFIGRARPPWTILEGFVSSAIKTLKLGLEETINQFDLVSANNNNPRDHVVIPDNTPILELADYIQNKAGGIYSTGLGFYIQGRCIYTWPMYDTSRTQTAKKLLTVILAPSRHSMMIDRTWLVKGRKLMILSAGISKVIDDTAGKLNIQGNGVRFMDASKIIGDNGTVKDNKFTMSRSQNVNEFITTVVGNGQNTARGSDPTTNVYLEASKLAARSVVYVLVPWIRSNPDLIVPGMPTEIIFEYAGDVQTMNGVLLEAYHSYELEGRGMIASRHRAKTSLLLAVDRLDPAYLMYLKNGGTLSPAPEMGAI